MLLNPNGDDFLSKANYYRGAVIHAFIFLEKNVEFILSEYFVGDSHRVFRFESVILDRMSFEIKRASLKYLFEKIEVDLGFVKTKSNSHPCKDLFNELRLLNDQRNYFAHYFLVKPNDINDVMQLEEFRDNGRSYNYTADKIQSIVDRITTASDLIKNRWEFYKSTGVIDDYNQWNESDYYDDLDDQ